jgi:VEFS-Box of polycomb protein
MGKPNNTIPNQRRLVRDAFPRDLVGDVILDFEKDHHRGSRYLLRNIKSVLRHHEKRFGKRKASHLRASDLKKGTNFNNSQSFSRTQSLGDNSSRTSFSAAQVPSANKQDDDLPPFADYVKDSFVAIYESPFGQAELLLNITHLSAKFDSTPDTAFDSEKQSCRCTISVMLLDMGPERSQIVREQSRQCELVMNRFNKNIKVKLEEPFRLAWKVSQNSRCHVGITLSPAQNATSDWPPVAVRSSIQNEFGLMLGGSELDDLSTGLVATYENLPLFRKHVKVLPLIYASNKTTFKTWHKLEVSIDWVSPQPKTLNPKCQRRSSRPSRNEHRTPTWKKLNQDTRQAAEVRVSYTLAASEETKYAAEWRMLTFRGSLHCPFCQRKHADFDNITHLRFHLMTRHPAQNFVLQEPKSKERQKNPTSYNFEVSTAKRKLDKVPPWLITYSWVAPPTPFNPSAYISGDESWPGTDTPRPLKELPPPATQNPIIALRKKHGGFLPAQHVVDIPIRQRKTYRVVPTKTSNNLPLFTSVTHRQLQPDEELSESDDDVDETWLRDKHAQQIMDMTHLPLAEREFQIRWNDHVKSERLPHTFYLSDVFVRWVRKDCEWLRADKERLRMYHRFEQGLRDRGKLSNVVCRGCWGILYGKISPADKDKAAMEVDGV